MVDPKQLDPEALAKMNIAKTPSNEEVFQTSSYCNRRSHGPWLQCGKPPL